MMFRFNQDLRRIQYQQRHLRRQRMAQLERFLLRLLRLQLIATLLLIIIRLYFYFTERTL